MLRHTPWTVAALFLAGSAMAQETSTTLDRAAREAMEQTGARGLAVAMIDKGQVVSVRAYGVRNAKGDPLTTGTVMYGASLTKAMFGYLAVQLAAEGRLQLDQPIADLLPDPLPSYGNLDAYGNWGDLVSDDRWRLITPRMVLTHSTGFANFAFLEPDGRLRIHFDPGTRYAYSGEGMMLLQFGLERGLGMNIEEELQKRYFQPLGMTRTSLMWRADFATDLADGWDAEGNIHPHDERSRVRAAGSMDTTISDMAQMAAYMVRADGLSPEWRQLYPGGTLPITTKQQFPTMLPDAPEAERPQAKAGWGVITFPGPQGPGWYKGGHNDTTANTLVCLQEGQRCVLILSNDVRAESAFPKLVRIALGETGVPYPWEYPELPEY